MDSKPVSLNHGKDEFRHAVTMEHQPKIPLREA